MKPPREVRYYEKHASNGAPRAPLLDPVHNNESTPVTLKPDGGLWTSPVDAEYGWDQWCRDEGMTGWLGRCWRLRVAGTPTLAVVDSREHLDDLARRYPLERNFGTNCVYRSIDFEKLAADVDGLWVTTNGHYATRWADLGEPSTNAWDCETVLWFRWCFSQAREEVIRVDHETA